MEQGQSVFDGGARDCTEMPQRLARDTSRVVMRTMLTSATGAGLTRAG
jgi:hypothetical protein